MGCGASVGKDYVTEFRPIPDRFKTYQEVSAALRAAGLECSQLIVGVDFTKSNTWTGAKTFGGRCLHELQPSAVGNPYQQVLSILAKTLGDFDDDNCIPAYGFGDATTKDRAVFSFQEGDVPCDGLEGVLQAYERIVPAVTLNGPTSFAAIIRQAIELVRSTNEYHILVIVADGQVDKEEETAKAIVDASHVALSIVTVGVGDGPWEVMDKFDDELPTRQFDNFQFVDFSSIMKRYTEDRREAAFAMHALMEIPDQYQFIKKHGLMQVGKRHPSQVIPPRPLGPPQLGASRRSKSEGRGVNRSETVTSFSFSAPEGLSPAADDLRQLVQGLMDETWSQQTTRDRGFQTVAQFEVVQVLQNNNAKNWSSYCHRREHLGRLDLPHIEDRFGPVKTVTRNFEAGLQEPRRVNANEFFLFHGTKPGAAQRICDSDFNIDLSGTNVGNMYGPGIYFAESSAKADEYATDDQDGLYKGLYAMLLCRVCLGNPAYSADRSPDVAFLQKQLTKGDCHAILGDRERAVGTYREFIIREPGQAYPAFAIIYRRRTA